jgi:hypothetical protein
VKSIARHTPWTSGEVKRHCARCEVEVERLQRFCHVCSVPFARSVLTAITGWRWTRVLCVLPPCLSPATSTKAVVRMWHPDGEDRFEVLHGPRGTSESMDPAPCRGVQDEIHRRWRMLSITEMIFS